MNFLFYFQIDLENAYDQGNFIEIVLVVLPNSHFHPLSIYCNYFNLQVWFLYQVGSINNFCHPKLNGKS